MRTILIRDSEGEGMTLWDVQLFARDALALQLDVDTKVAVEQAGNGGLLSIQADEEQPPTTAVDDTDEDAP